MDLSHSISVGVKLVIVSNYYIIYIYRFSFYLITPSSSAFKSLNTHVAEGIHFAQKICLAYRYVTQPADHFCGGKIV